MKRTMKLAALLLCVLCALSLAGCKNAAEDSGGSTPTPSAPFQIKDAATFKTFASNSEPYGVVVESFNVTETIDFEQAVCDKTVDLQGKTITFSNGGIYGASTKYLTLCDTNTTKGTITGDGFDWTGLLAGKAYCLVYIRNGSVKDGINVTMNREDDNDTSAIYFEQNALELNANASVTNNTAKSKASEGTWVKAIEVSTTIGNITGGSYTATSKNGYAKAIYALNVTKISAGKFKATTTSGEAYGIHSVGDVTSISDGVEFIAEVTAGGTGSIHNKIGTKTSGYSAGVIFTPPLGT